MSFLGPCLIVVEIVLLASSAVILGGLIAALIAKRNYLEGAHGATIPRI